MLQQKQVFHIPDTESPDSCTVTKKCDIAMFLRFKNVLFETGASNSILSEDIFMLFLVKELTSKFFGVSFQTLCIKCWPFIKENMFTENF